MFVDIMLINPFEKSYLFEYILCVSVKNNLNWSSTRKEIKHLYMQSKRNIIFYFKFSETI